MKKSVLLIDESITVQKVISLTLSKSKYFLSYAKSKAEGLRKMGDEPPDLILVSDSVSDFESQSFHREIEMVLKGVKRPKLILITSKEIRECRDFNAVLKKPFTPQELIRLVGDELSEGLKELPSQAGDEDLNDDELQRVFNNTFSNEENLVKETFEQNNRKVLWKKEGDDREPVSSPQLWTADEKSITMTHSGQKSAPSKGLHSFEDEVEKKLRENLDVIVERLLSKMLPPIVERIVEDRLDELLLDQEKFVDIKS